MLVGGLVCDPAPEIDDELAVADSREGSSQLTPLGEVPLELLPDSLEAGGGESTGGGHGRDRGRTPGLPPEQMPGRRGRSSLVMKGSPGRVRASASPFCTEFFHASPARAKTGVLD